MLLVPPQVMMALIRGMVVESIMQINAIVLSNAFVWYRLTSVRITSSDNRCRVDSQERGIKDPERKLNDDDSKA